MKWFCPAIPLFSWFRLYFWKELIFLMSLMNCFTWELCKVHFALFHLFKDTDASFLCYVSKSGPGMCIYSLTISIIWIPDSICGFLFGFSLHDTGGDWGSGSRDEQRPQLPDKGELTLLSKQLNKSTAVYSPPFVLLIKGTTKSLANTKLAEVMSTPVVFMENRMWEPREQPKELLRVWRERLLSVAERRWIHLKNVPHCGNFSLTLKHYLENSLEVVLK